MKPLVVVAVVAPLAFVAVAGPVGAAQAPAREDPAPLQAALRAHVQSAQTPVVTAHGPAGTWTYQWQSGSGCVTVVNSYYPGGRTADGWVYDSWTIDHRFEWNRVAGVSVDGSKVSFSYRDRGGESLQFSTPADAAQAARVVERLVAACAPLPFPPLPADGHRWVRLWGSDDLVLEIGDDALVGGDKPQAWTRMRFREPVNTVSGQPIDAHVSFRRYDCVQWRQTIVEEAVYLSGAKVQSNTVESAAAPPERKTLDEALMTAVCRRQPPP